MVQAGMTSETKVKERGTLLKTLCKTIPKCSRQSFIMKHLTEDVHHRPQKHFSRQMKYISCQIQNKSIMKNQTHFHYFILEGLFTLETHSLTMLAISMIYLLTLTGNMLIIFVVYHQTSLHTSMYFFITNLSFLEIWYVSLTTPKLLAMLMTKDKRISFQWCFAQLYMFHSLGITECNLLAIMAIDRFVAICKPLRYNAIMNINVCKNLALLCWITGFSMAIIPATLTSRVPFCGNFVKHYFCDLAPLLSLACGDITATVTINSCVGGFFSMFNLSVVIIMYINIIATVAKIKTRKGQMKAFSTCSSHLAVALEDIQKYRSNNFHKGDEFKQFI
ncbi:olfactory receptor 6N2-like [Gastrophryne carolinensis]